MTPQGIKMNEGYYLSIVVFADEQTDWLQMSTSKFFCVDKVVTEKGYQQRKQRYRLTCGKRWLEQ